MKKNKQSEIKLETKTAQKSVAANIFDNGDILPFILEHTPKIQTVAASLIGHICTDGFLAITSLLTLPLIRHALK